MCAFHKTKNFKKKINSLGFRNEEKESFENSFDHICYSSHHDKAMEHLGKLLQVLKLRSYLEKEIVPYLHKFSRSCLNRAHCLGYNVTSPAESMNHMLKMGLPDKTLTLVESRIEFNQILENHIMITTEKVMSKRVPSDVILYQKYMPRIASDIKL